MTADDHDAAALPAEGGLSWSCDLDLDALLAAVADLAPAAAATSVTPATPVSSGPGPVDAAPSDDGQDAELAEYLEAIDAGRSQVVPLPAVAGVLAESLSPGPDLAGWLASAQPMAAQDQALPGLASAYRRLASWAQAGELAAVAQLASRSAAADDHIGADDQGRPASLPADACGQVSLALTLSQATASWWTDLAVTLRWRLPATGAALRAGVIDLSRARAIAEATSVLDEQTAREVESRVLGRAGQQTLGQLRAALRRAVIAADPRGAERRRQEAERRARVMLYPDAEGTATLAGYSLPGIAAAAAIARITALAQARKASGTSGGIDLLRSEVFLGLLLGTLPHIPPAPGAPPDDSCPPNDDPPGSPCPPHDNYPPEDAYPTGSDTPGDDPSGNDYLPDADYPTGSDDPADDHCPAGSDDPADGRAPDIDVAGPASWPPVSAFVRSGPAAMGYLAPIGNGFLDLTVPWSTLNADSTEPGHLGRLGAITPAQASYLAQLAARDPKVDWRVIITGSNGHALAVTRIRRPSTRAGPAPPNGSSAHDTDHCGLVKRVTITITRDDLTARPEGRQESSGGDLPARLAQILAAASRAADRAAQQEAADTAAGGCAHTEATPAYRPPPRLSDYIAARDITCRFPTCRQPAARCDLDHTKPYDQGGRTCACNLGPLCRRHHVLKQHPRWHLAQPKAGVFTWTTPTGRTYTTGPDSHAA